MMIVGPRARCRDKNCPDHPHEVACTHCGQLVQGSAYMGPLLPEGGTEERLQGSLPSWWIPISVCE